ncbi:MAG: rhamnose ABC transporter substrate-binding protein [Armatimonadetes bacterium]|nr:rhamnose ABC transporter substrate-binding protein [Armatimonadota bacterium]
MLTRKCYLALMGALLVSGIMTGCDKKSPEASTEKTATKEGGTAPNKETVAAGTKESGKAAEIARDPTKRIKIVYIPKNTGNVYFDVVASGFKKAQTELGFDFDIVAPATADAASQIPFIKQQIQLKVDAIAISPNSPDAVKPALQEALAKGIHVITIDADLTGNEDGREAYVIPADSDLIAKSQIDLISELIGGKGEIAILSATTDAPNQNIWIKVMNETLKDPKFKDIQLVDTVYGNDQDQKSATEAQALLLKHPNLKGIIAPTSVGIVSAVRVVETAGKANSIAVTGLGMPNNLRKYVQTGSMKKFALWNPADMGYIGSYLLVGLTNGKIKPANGASFEAGTLKERKFGELNKVIAGPPLVFDKGNIEQFHF